MGRKSKAVLAAEAAAAEAQTQELAKVEVVDGEKVVTDLEPESKAPENASVDPNGEDLGDVSSEPAKTPVIESGEAVDPTETIVEGEEPSEAPEPEQDSEATPEQAAITDAINQEIIAELTERVKSFEYTLEEGFSPILRPTMVGDAYTGHIPCPKAVFDLVQTEGWQGLIDAHPAKHGLKSVLYWKQKNGSAVVRCMSSSKFADVV